MSITVHKPVASYRMVILIILFMLFISLLIWRAFDLNINKRGFLQIQGDSRYMRVLPMPTHRGMITDRNGETLAISTPVDSVWVYPKDFLTAKSRWSELAKVLDINLAHLTEMVTERQNKEFVYLKRRVSPEIIQQALALGIPGLATQREYRRYYPAAEVTSHLIGFTNIDDEGQEGLELAYNSWLQGQPGKKRVLKDRLGRVIQHLDLVKPPKPGKDLVLSIDRRLQYLAYRELKKSVMQHKAKAGSAVVLDAKTGEVLAMVNQPSFNPNRRSGLQSKATRNRVITDVFEPGSTIKPFTIAAALESGYFTTTSRIDTRPGIFKIGHNTIRDIRNYGVINLGKIIQKSSNVGASKIALKIPSKSLWSTHNAVGFGHSTQSGYPGEATGMVSAYKQWRDIERATLSYGYGISVTPLQLARAYAVLANKGQLEKINLLRVDEPESASQVMSEKTAKVVTHMMEMVIDDEGTGHQAHIPGYRVAGKTGTVKKLSLTGYSEDKYLSLFAGFVPASNPKFVMVVLIDQPTDGKYYGGAVAAPVFAKVMAGALRMMDIMPDDLNQDIHIAKAGDKL